MAVIQNVVRAWRELRGDTGNYHDQILAGAFPALTPGGVQAATLGALQAAAGTLARAMVTASVEGDRGALTPDTLYAIAYDLVRHGQYVALLEVRGTGARLLRADANAPTYGGPERESWRYNLTIGGPSHTRTQNAPAAAVCHVLWNADSITPWRGRGPLAVAASSGTLAALMARSLTGEAAIPSVRVTAMPAGQGEETGKRLAQSVRSKHGGIAFPETTYAAGGQGRTAAPAADWKGQRYGFDAEQSAVNLHALMHEEVFGACGVPTALAPGSKAAGPAAREAFRQLLVGTVEPLSRLVAAEVGRVLESPVKLSFTKLAAVDVAARGRAVHILAQAGVERDEAMRLVGWTE